MRTGPVAGVSSLMSGEESRRFEQKVAKETKGVDRSSWGVKMAWLGQRPFGSVQGPAGGSTRASPSLRILRFLCCLMFKNPIQLRYHALAGRKGTFSVSSRERVGGIPRHHP